MPKAYFEPANLSALAEVFNEAKKVLERRGVARRVDMDRMAKHILELNSKGLTPKMILYEILASDVSRLFAARRVHVPADSERRQRDRRYMPADRRQTMRHNQPGPALARKGAERKWTSGPDGTFPASGNYDSATLH